jgi:lysophospholipase L1-like esterase
MSLLVSLLFLLPDPPKPHDFARWEKSIAAFEKQDQTTPPPKNAVLFVGSSSIVKWNLKKHFPGLDAINRGFGGSEMADSAHFAPRIVFKYKPRLIVVYAGDNDIAAGQSPEKVRDDFRDFVRVVRTELKDTPIIYLSIKPSVKRRALWDKMHRANRLVEEVCARDASLTYLDVGKLLLDKDGKPRPELFARDGLHLSEKGYDLWTARLKPLLKAK